MYIICKQCTCNMTISHVHVQCMYCVCTLCLLLLFPVVLRYMVGWALICYPPLPSHITCLTWEICLNAYRVSVWHEYIVQIVPCFLTLIYNYCTCITTTCTCISLQYIILIHMFVCVYLCTCTVYPFLNTGGVLHVHVHVQYIQCSYMCTCIFIPTIQVYYRQTQESLGNTITCTSCSVTSVRECSMTDWLIKLTRNTSTISLLRCHQNTSQRYSTYMYASKLL